MIMFREGSLGNILVVIGQLKHFDVDVIDLFYMACNCGLICNVSTIAQFIVTTLLRFEVKHGMKFYDSNNK